MASIQSNVAAAPAQAIQSMASNSSFIALFEYDPVNLRLTTHLKSGAIYQHAYVIPVEWTSLQTAQNHGKHWANNIKGKKLAIKVKSAKAPRSEIKHGRK